MLRITRVTINRSEMHNLLRGPGGPVVQTVDRYTRRTANAARAGAPVDTGHLRASIDTSVRTTSTRVIGRVSSPLDYARFVHDGTGIYGPRRRPIRPKRAKMLAFRPKGGRTVVFAREVKGTKPRPFLLRALREVSPWPVTEKRQTP